MQILIVNYKRNQQMKEMQKIAANTKHKHRNLKNRFSLQQHYQLIQQRINTQYNQQTEIFNALLPQHNNVRQKLKIIKRLLESKEEKDSSARKMIARQFIDLHIKEYLYGNTESKPSLMNVLKLFNSVQPITFIKIHEAIQNIDIQEYKQARNVYELLEYFSKNQTLQNILLIRQKFTNAEKILFLEFDSCHAVIFGQGFKLKWMEHCVDVLRAINLLFRLYAKLILNQIREHVLNLCLQIITQYKVLTKQVLSQLYLLIIYINPQQPAPHQDQGNCLIHYLHAQNVVLNRNIMPDLMHLLPNIKQTQYKCQLVPILLKAFQQHYSHYQDKVNSFDQVVTLFDVGRSVYTYLQEIVVIIIKDQNSVWNLEGNYLRKFFIATIALRLNIPTDVLFKQWPTIISDLITQAGSMMIPYTSDCATILFQRLFEQSNKDYTKWSSIWMGDYQKALLSEDRGHVRGIIEFINPIILSVNSEPLLLKQIMCLSQKQQNSVPLQMGVIALLKCYKDLGKIVIDNQRKSFIHADDAKIEFKKDQIRTLMLSSDTIMALKALEFVTVHPKGSMPMEPLELQLALEFYRNCLKTSLPQYRKSYLTATKKIFDRLRTTYDTQLTKTAQELKKNKRFKPRPFFTQFKTFLANLIDLCYQNVFPDVIFQLANPVLQILLLIGQFFSRKQIQIKQGQIYQSTPILNETSYFRVRNFDNLLCCLQSSYESVRELAHQILQLFYNLDDQKKLKSLWDESLENANKLTIKSYEYACRILALISQVYPQVIDFPNRYALRQLNICDLFLTIIRKRYEIFKIQFATQQQNYYQNLIHGMLTVFSYTLDHLSSKIRANPETFAPHFSQLKIFLTEFFELINQIVLFSVEVCSSNISTVVLDSLPQSQTDKKYKVDCRGHFLEETSKAVSGLIQSTALLTSMQNQEQGIENTLVVSFYLLTREAGLVFQSISNITATAHSQQYLPVESLVQLVNSYFYALINLKHMGSVDRIAGGLGKMSRLIFDNQDKKLSQLPDKLLDKLVSNLKDGNFTNILRRSAGVPYAFTCLLKSEAIKRKQMIEKTVGALLQLSSSQQPKNIELRIHSLNILKKIFQDGDLKGDLECYVSKAFISSIRGFTSEEWGVRNSSLMLFTVLANRSVGIKPTYNLLEFFHRCPDLLDFFLQQLHNLRLNTMYPPLYPIVLILSRLVPFDLSERVKLPNKGELNLKQIRKDRLLQLLPLIEKAGLNSNHMGRVMAAKAILPFMDIEGIIPYCLDKLKDIKSIKQNNLLHYRITVTYNLFLSLYEIQQAEKYESKLSQQTVHKIVKTIKQVNGLICRKQSAAVSESLLKLIHHLLNHFQKEITASQQMEGLTKEILSVTTRIIDHYFTRENLIVENNMGNSVAVKQCLDLHMDLLGKHQLQPDITVIELNFEKFMVFLTQKLTNHPHYLLRADTEIIQAYLYRLTKFMTDYKFNTSLEQKIKNLLNSLLLQEIASDAILIKVLELRAFLKVGLKPEDESFLKNSVQKTQNHFLKIAIFKYIQSINLNHEFLLPLIYNFSRPEELEQLRQCCVQYFEVYPNINQQHYIGYIRLLQDEQYEIRLQMAKILANKLKLAQLNEQVIKNIVLSKLSVDQFTKLLLQVSDYEIKKKNYQQQRIFSYDKPNKYRSDISNVIYCLLNNQNLRNSKAQILSYAVHKAFKMENLDWKEEDRCIHKYLNDILTRNEYQFQYILRIYLIRNSQYSQEFEVIFKEHPLLEKVASLYKLKWL